jgi:hypothetical protein
MFPAHIALGDPLAAAQRKRHDQLVRIVMRQHGAQGRIAKAAEKRARKNAKRARDAKAQERAGYCGCEMNRVWLEEAGTIPQEAAQ